MSQSTSTYALILTIIHSFVKSSRVENSTLQAIQVYCIIFNSPHDDCTGDVILWILIFTRHHGLTPCTLFHGPYKKFYFCVKCCHTLCPLTRINIKGHYVLYLTSPNWIYANMFLLSTFSSMHVNISYFCNLHMWISTIFSHADIAGSFRVSLVVGVHSIWAHGGGESFFGTFMCVFD